MTQFERYGLPKDATHLVVMDSLRSLVWGCDLNTERPKAVYIPKGDSLYWLGGDDNPRHYITRPGIDEDMSVEIDYSALPPMAVLQPDLIEEREDVSDVTGGYQGSGDYAPHEEEGRQLGFDSNREGDPWGVTPFADRDLDDTGGQARMLFQGPDAEAKQDAYMKARPDYVHAKRPETPILKYFAYEHLKDSNLRAVSKYVHDVAQIMDEALPDGAEKSAGLRKLLEAKDCFVRAAL